MTWPGARHRRLLRHAANLYYRRVRVYRIAESTREEMHAHMDSLSNDMICADIAQLIDYADRDDAAKPGKLGCVGYC